jgi:putative ABC transport system permease protein
VAITEQTRENGVLRSLGATDGALRGLILAEAVAIGVVSWLVAAAALAFGAIFGNLLLNTPLAMTVNSLAVAGWLLLVCGICVVAAWLPARRAARMTNQQTLAYE